MPRDLIGECIRELESAPLFRDEPHPQVVGFARRLIAASPVAYGPGSAAWLHELIADIDPDIAAALGRES